MKNKNQLITFLQQFPFIAILRGVESSEVLEISSYLFDCGFRILEVPLHSPEPFRSIRVMAEAFGDRALIGAGTVTSTKQVQQVADAGGQMIISPHYNPAIVAATKGAELLSLPGVVTPSEAFAALEMGADALKLFPAEGIPPAMVKAMKTVLPQQTPLIPVGGIDTDNWQGYWSIGAAGFGVGSSLYKKGMSMNSLKDNARKFQSSWQKSVTGA